MCASVAPALPAFPEDLVQEADVADNVARRVARRIGTEPCVGGPFFQIGSELLWDQLNLATSHSNRKH